MPQARMNHVDLRRYLDQRREQLRVERASWVPQWRELAEHIAPHAGRFDAPYDTEKGRKKHGKIVNGTPQLAIRTLEAGLMNGGSSPARPWGRLGTLDPELALFHPVRLWLEQASDIVHRILRRSNVYRTLAHVYKELGVFGTSAAIVEPHDADVIHCTALTVGEYMLQEDDEGNVTTLFREFEMSVGQMVRRFGYEKCSPHVQMLADSRAWDTRIAVAHAIEPREDYDPQSNVATEMPFASCYWEWGSDKAGNGILSESGYRRFPAVCPRWEVLGGNIYGWSPGMAALGDCKQLQAMEKLKGTALAKRVDPALQVPEALKNREIDSLPGGRATVPDGDRAGIRPMHDTQVPLTEFEREVMRVEDRIRSHFYADLFAMFAMRPGTQPLTAEETRLREAERIANIGQIYDNLQRELYTPLWDFVVDQCFERGLFPPAPPELEGQELSIEFVSTLAQAQKSVDLIGLDRLVTTAAALAQARPEVVDKLAADDIIDIYADGLGVDPRAIKSTEDVQRLREARAQAQAAQAQVENLQAQAAVAKDLATAAATAPPVQTNAPFPGYEPQALPL